MASKIMLVALVALTGCAGFYRSTPAYDACERKNRSRGDDDSVDRFCVDFAKQNESEHYGEGETHTDCTFYGNSASCTSTSKQWMDALPVPTMPRD